MLFWKRQPQNKFNLSVTVYIIDLEHSFMRKKIILVQKGKGFSFDLLLGPVLGLAELVLEQPVHIA